MLPADYARCPGETAPACQFCMRREPVNGGDLYRVVWMQFRPTRPDYCESFIGPPQIVAAGGTSGN